MEHKVIISTGGEIKDKYERGSITYISKYSDDVLCKVSIWSDKDIEDETLDNLNYNVFLETLPEIETLQDLDVDTVSAIIDDALESFSLNDLLKNGDSVAQQIYLANKNELPITLEIPSQHIGISANSVLIDYLVCDIALRDVTEGITKIDLVNLAKLIQNDLDAFNGVSLNFLKEIVTDFLTQVSFSKYELAIIKDIQRALSINDNDESAASSIIKEEAMQGDELISCNY